MHRHRRTTLSTILGALLASALLAACGSALDPSTVAGARGPAGAGGPAATAPGATGSGAAAPGTGASVAPAGDTQAPDGTGGSTTGAVEGSGGPPSGATGGGTSGGSGSGTSGATAGGGGDGPGSGTGGAGGATGGAGTGSGGDSGSGAAAGACDGFTNGPGITDSTITIGNSSDISGPVPGLFQQSQDATQAYVDYFNSTTDGICGRKLVLKNYDSRTDGGADQQSYVAACSEVFAMVGSMSAFDSGGAATAQNCGLPDIRSAIVTTERGACTTCFGAQSTATGEVQNAAADFVLKNYGDAGQHAAFLYIDAGASAESAPRQADAMQKRGLHFDYVQPIGTTEFNYTPYVQALKDKKIQVVFWTGAASMSVRLRQTMQQQGYTPTLYLRDPTDYTPDFVTSGGSAVDGTVVFMNFVPFEEASSSPEMQLYLSYLDQSKPGADPGFFGVFSWSAARLFTDLAMSLGGKLTRATLIDALRRTKDWTGHGIHSVQHPGPHRTGDCFRFLELHGGVWKPLGGRAYQCDGTTKA